ncbi:MurR/RpiR family transcriptional regulator [Erysipelothrix urinaevulpis]|uniref:MurR/RpiR family transcriptional regulator n=1 Tax=Erysipelothrix urinaevulpis TaxID=2683717 RepID=UPI001357178C|nr:MurR/RpiR family transcriptional regulator [Erysipelothrix urinaevulpis]
MKYKTSIIDSIDPSSDQFTSNEKKIATFISHNLGIIPEMTIQELSDRTGTSPAAISRFCKKIDSDSFQSFKVNLSSELALRPYINENVQSIDSVDAETILSINTNLMKSTLENIDEEQIDQAIAAIQKADIIFVHGIGFSKLSAQNIRLKWSLVGKTIIIVEELDFARSTLPTVADSALFIALSNSGKSVEILSLLSTVKDLNIPTLAITRNNGNTLAMNTDIQLHTASLSSKPSATTPSFYSQSILIDYLYFRYLEKME